MKTDERIKVLCVTYESNPYGGVAVFLMNVFRNIDHEKFQLDFLSPVENSYDPYEREIQQANGKIYALHVDAYPAVGKLKFGRKLHAFLKNHPYDIVYINSSAVSYDCISAIVSKYNGAKVIVHSHNTGGRSLWKAPIAYLMKLLMQKQADVLCACSKDAAATAFTAKMIADGHVTIIKNGIDLQKFQYKKEIRDKVRRELNLNGHFVIGHVGRFSEQKNHEFIIDIFTEILKKESSAVLLLVGQGKLEPAIQEKVRRLHIEDNVIFLGERDDVADLYQAMDAFLFPSLFEGLGIVLIEAQASGLPCVVSDIIPKEADVTTLIHRESLKASPYQWAKKVLENKWAIDNRCSHEKDLSDAGYDIKMTTLSIVHIFESLIKT